MVQQLTIKWLAIWLAATLISLLFTVVVSLAWLKLSHQQLLGVQTASMVPTFKPGDAIIVKHTKQLQLGTIISYHDPRNPNIVISHRLIKIDSKTGWLTTAGDARHSADSSFPPDLVMGQAVWLLPNLGRVIDWLRSPFGLVIAIYLPIILIIASEWRRLANIYAAPLYNARL